MDNRPIGLLDSGAGGFSVVKKVIAKLPHESTIFIGDNLHMPYGDKSKDEVINLTRKSVHFLLSKNVKLIIFACNTATAVAMQQLQSEIKPQIIGVVQSGSLLASQTSKTKKVAVAATPVTVESHAYQKEIYHRDPQIKVIELATPKLAPLVEEMKDYQTNLAVVKESLKPLAKEDFDTFIMGCTHYPLIQKEIEAILPAGIKIVDPADQVAQYTENVLKRDHLTCSPDHEAKHEFYTTGSSQTFSLMGQRFLGDPNLKASHVETGNL